MWTEEGIAMLAERIDEWNRKLKEEGRNEGREEVLLRLLKKKFGALPKGTRKRITEAEPELLLEWIDRVLSAKSVAEVFSD
jgi:hypothetical protein